MMKQRPKHKRMTRADANTVSVNNASMSNVLRMIADCMDAGTVQSAHVQFINCAGATVAVTPEVMSVVGIGHAHAATNKMHAEERETVLRAAAVSADADEREVAGRDEVADAVLGLAPLAGWGSKHIMEWNCGKDAQP